MLPEDDLIVFRRGMYATYGKRVRYYVEKMLIERTRIAPPAMPTIRIDPAIAQNSLRVIKASDVEGEPASRGAGQAPTQSTPATTPANGGEVVEINTVAVKAALAVPPGAWTKKLFDHLVAVGARAA